MRDTDWRELFVWDQELCERIGSETIGVFG